MLDIPQTYCVGPRTRDHCFTILIILKAQINHGRKAEQVHRSPGSSNTIKSSDKDKGLRFWAVGAPRDFLLQGTDLLKHSTFLVRFLQLVSAFRMPQKTGGSTYFRIRAARARQLTALQGLLANCATFFNSGRCFKYSHLGHAWLHDLSTAASRRPHGSFHQVDMARAHSRCSSGNGDKTVFATVMRNSISARSYGTLLLRMRCTFAARLRFGHFDSVNFRSSFSCSFTYSRTVTGGGAPSFGRFRFFNMERRLSGPRRVHAPIG